MDTSTVLDLGREGLLIMLEVSGPVMLTAVVVGLVISIGQAVTQIQDQTISFVPKIIMMVLAILYTLPWITSLMVEYSTNLITNIPTRL
ncbi:MULTISPECIES: flagellar biosynthesis protein FliQ [Gimesia]|jgi:flagellar biosynthetic protein FliQ|uniref:Flagellar biosynthetic protein FliQ n=1 Tax=Gimesia maris TaxID=122 RepID=A0A3D3RBV6_9PLAN|nr:flagellar biosynthesis protein FliQ [Gimesia maris]MAC51346.1 flagellar biosynthetic protein FliQ [Gimesia sp.]MCA9006429.1 flagellar biosynthesis protein FliQ [Planctomycetaceae bacterium]EDL56791.1 flagellar biosynthesis protein Q [Gimesia maris DSM 8797]QDT78766.1 Flagellar biosynthetic protein FliQ [Gimesia maris]QDU14299.1 Flagellar biosynthetic protein FliQ [Gimesia maris]|tara:strand:- start:60 stop:326 length:267 start_codon:yes stop_codon:yes gene_type:complete